jgi:hypothetical protein
MSTKLNIDNDQSTTVTTTECLFDSKGHVTYGRRRTITLLRKLNLNIYQGFLKTPLETLGFYQKGGFLNSFTPQNSRRIRKREITQPCKRMYGEALTGMDRTRR